MQKILVICGSGIGNSILFTPALRILRKNYPNARIVLLVVKKALAEPVRGSNLVDEIVALGSKSFWQQIKNIFYLRKEKFDYSITAFPSNHWQFDVLAFLIGAKKRITHSYSVGKWRTLSFLQNQKIPAVEGIHDVEQNINLLKLLNIVPEKEERLLLFFISQNERDLADKFLKDNNIESRFLVGIHPGCDKHSLCRRWPAEYFIELIEQLMKKGKTVLLFAGPHELMEVEAMHNKVAQKDKNVLIVKDKNLKEVAAIIEKCQFFLSTDSGLGHIATALKVSTLAIFGPAYSSRTRPYSIYGHYLSLNLPCSPCLKYPFFSTSTKIECSRNFECLRALQPKRVIEAIEEILI